MNINELILMSILILKIVVLLFTLFLLRLLITLLGVHITNEMKQFQNVPELFRMFENVPAF